MDWKSRPQRSIPQGVRHRAVSTGGIVPSSGLVEECSSFLQSCRCPAFTPKIHLFAPSRASHGRDRGGESIGDGMGGIARPAALGRQPGCLRHAVSIATVEAGIGDDDRAGPPAAWVGIVANRSKRDARRLAARSAAGRLRDRRLRNRLHGQSERDRNRGDGAGGRKLEGSRLFCPLTACRHHHRAASARRSGDRIVIVVARSSNRRHHLTRNLRIGLHPNRKHLGDCQLFADQHPGIDDTSLRVVEG